MNNIKRLISRLLQLPKKKLINNKMMHISIPEDQDVIHASHNVHKVNGCGVQGYFKECIKDKKGSFCVEDTNKVIATERLGRVLGLEDMIPHAEYCIADIGDRKNVVGVFQEESPGTEIWGWSTKKRIERMTPGFQRALSIVRIFDVICHEADHSLNNYYPVLDACGRLTNVSIFDNGGIGAFGLSTDISFSTYNGCDALFLDNGSINNGYIDREFSKRIRELRFKDVYAALHDCLRIVPILLTWIRIKKIKYRIANSVESGNVELLAPEMWSELTIREELSGKYGKSYFLSFVVDWGGNAEELDAYLKT